MNSLDLSKAMMDALSSVIGDASPQSHSASNHGGVQVEIAGLKMTLSIDKVIVKFVAEG